jgi:hypothetical protein
MSPCPKLALPLPRQWQTALAPGDIVVLTKDSSRFLWMSGSGKDFRLSQVINDNQVFLVIAVLDSQACVVYGDNIGWRLTDQFEHL